MPLVSILYPLKTSEKVFWCYHGIHKETNSMKCVNEMKKKEKA